jgi:hypothetical protein
LHELARQKENSYSRMVGFDRLKVAIYPGRHEQNSKAAL